MDINEAKRITTQFFRETRGGTNLKGLTPETHELVRKNINSIKKITTSDFPGINRMIKIWEKNI